MPKLEQCIALPGAWSVLVPSACAHATCASCQGAELYHRFLERDMSCQDISGEGWPSLAMPVRMAPAGCWCSVVRAHPEASLAHWLLPFAFDCAVPPACATKTTVFCPQPPFPALFTFLLYLLLLLLFCSLFLLLLFPPLLLNLYFFFSVPAKRYQSR